MSLIVGVRRDGLDRRGIAAQLLRDHDTWFAIGYNQTVEETFCGFDVAARLDQSVEYISIAINCTPQAMFQSVDRGDHFVHMPFVVQPWSVASDKYRDLSPKTGRPKANWFTTDDDATLRQEICDIRRAEGKPMMCPIRIGDDFTKNKEALQPRNSGRDGHGTALSKKDNAINLAMPVNIIIE